MSAIDDEVREEAVELLRCAADLLCNSTSIFPRVDAKRLCGAHMKSWNLALIVCSLVGGERDEVQLLSAAAALEDGWSPK